MPLTRPCVGEDVGKWTSYIACGSKLVHFQRATSIKKWPTLWLILEGCSNWTNAKDVCHNIIYNRKTEIIEIYYKRTLKVLLLTYIIIMSHLKLSKFMFLIWKMLIICVKRKKKLQKTVCGISTFVKISVFIYSV